MTHADVDTLLATLHPHISFHRVSDGMPPPGYLRPRKDTAAGVRKLSQAFATLFGYHPGCDVAAVALQTPQSNETSKLSISLSPSIPPGFEENAKEWLARFAALRKESRTESESIRVPGGVREGGDAFSPAEKSLILHTHRVCYPAMRRRALTQGFGDWDVFVQGNWQDVATYGDDPTLAQGEHADNTQKFSELVRRFADCVRNSGDSDSLGGDEDVLEFHKLCMAIRDMMSNRGFSAFLNGHICQKPALTYFSPPLALHTLLALSQDPKLALSDQWSCTVLCPPEAVRPFNAVVTKTALSERFGEVHRIRWKLVEQAFEIFVSGIPNWYSTGANYHWNSDTKSLSTTRPVVVHPEVALIQHLLENGVEFEGKVEAFIACSRLPCYASIVYAGMVNQTLKTRFTMDIDDRRCHQLYKAEPWILPEDARPDVVANMKEHLLEDLRMRVSAWVGHRWSDGYIASGLGPDLDWEDSESEWI
ncbi:hypothetical protein GSI_08351 [Ganoderma sinense ZZ0214-1]|uniref:Uncharacterized protein n=1 Tax=Ganoderma sinense ZZ0214-1 TaxID=1077348 RepID=A0A2G8S6Z2_9APHY|nr:hypothetical protein GSI_08351 [Ganoderma sinense ZZ0214-1]